jgi:hypothetical protein
LANLEIAWIRIIFCQGPRQVINALTLYSVFKAKLDPTTSNDVGSAFLNFFHQIGLLAEQSHQQAVILSGMVFTLVIWIFGALSLILAVLFYLLFLWHYIPNADGGLSGFCERKINRRLARIVSVKVNKAIEEEERKRVKADARAIKKGEKPLGRQATLPTLFDPKGNDSLPQMPMLNRNDTMATLPIYESRPGTPSGQATTATFELSSLDQKRPVNGRSFTGASAISNASYDSNAPLMNNASDMGYGRTGSPAPSIPALPPLDTNGYPLPPTRSLTNQSNANNWNRTPTGGPPRMPSAMGDRGYTASPVSYSDGSSPINRPSLGSVDPYARPMPRQVDELNGRSFTPAGPAPSMGRRTPFDPEMNRSTTPGGPAPSMGRRTPFEQYPNSPSTEYGRNSPAPSNFNRGPNTPIDNQSQYQTYNPNGNPSYNENSRGPAQDDYFANNNAPPMPRPGTAQSQGSRLGPGPAGGINRLASPAPYNGGSVQSPAYGPNSPAYNGNGSPMYRR